MMDEAKYEFLAAIAYVKNDIPWLVEGIERALQRKVDARLLIDAGSIETHLVKKLRATGIPFRVRQNCHHKFAIADHAILLGSFNWYDISYRRNGESALYSTELNHVYPTRTEFLRLWESAEQI